MCYLNGYNPNTKMPLQFDTLYYLNICTATIHLISGVIISIGARGLDPVAPSLSSGNSTGPYLPAVCFGPTPGGGRPRFHIEPESVAETRDYLTTLVVTFFLLSAGFQYAQSWNKQEYSQRVKSNGVNELRYVEYSISASVMMILIACVVGVYDVFTHILIFTCTFLCMMLGLVADFVRVLTENMKTVNKTCIIQDTSTERDDEQSAGRYGNEKQSLVPVSNTPSADDRTLIEECIRHGEWLMWGIHGLGWVAIMVPYLAVFMVAYFNTIHRSWDCLANLGTSVPEVPWFVTLIIVIQLGLFSSFGVVQIVQFYKSGKKNYNAEAVGIYTELAFITLSLAAKSLLGWLAATQIIFA